MEPTKREHIRALLAVGTSIAEAARITGAHYSYASAVSQAYRKELRDLKGKIKKPKGIPQTTPQERARLARDRKQAAWETTSNSET